MNLYLISQTTNNDYDTYDSVVVAAETEDQARRTFPEGGCKWRDDAWWFQYASGREEKEDNPNSWTMPENVTVKQIGIADPNTEAGVILASFNAG